MGIWSKLVDQVIMAGYLVMKRFQDQLELEGERVPLYTVTVLLLDVTRIFPAFFFQVSDSSATQGFCSPPFQG